MARRIYFAGYSMFWTNILFIAISAIAGAAIGCLIEHKLSIGRKIIIYIKRKKINKFVSLLLIVVAGSVVTNVLAWVVMNVWEHEIMSTVVRYMGMGIYMGIFVMNLFEWLQDETH